MTTDKREQYRQFKAVDSAYREGNLDALRTALGNPENFPNCVQPFELAVGEYPLQYAIYWSPRAMIEGLLALGADPNYPDRSFPSLIAVLSTDREDKYDLLAMLMSHGADLGQRGLNDWTPLHYAVSRRDLKAIEILLVRGADRNLRTRIDEYSTPLEDAARLGFDGAVTLMRKFRSQGGGNESE